MPPAARVGDMVMCPMQTPTPGGPVPHVGGPLMVGCPTVLIGGMPAVRVGDPTLCTGGGLPGSVIKGSSTVMIAGMPAARMGDTAAHGGTISLGFPGVMIGG